MFPAGLKSLDNTSVSPETQKILDKIEEAEQAERKRKEENHESFRFKPANTDIFSSTQTIRFDKQDLENHFNVRGEKQATEKHQVIDKQAVENGISIPTILVEDMGEFNITPYDRTELSERDFSRRFDIPVKEVTKAESKSKKNVIASIIYAVSHMLALSGGLTLLFVSWFSLRAWVAILIALAVSTLLYGVVYLGEKKGKSLIVNSVALGMTGIFVLAIAAVVQKCGSLMFNQCSYLLSLVIVILIGFLFCFVSSIRKESRR